MASRNPMRVLSALCLASLAGSAHAAPDFELAQLRTKELRLLYQDPQQTYLTPYVARCMLNALELQKRILRWNPEEEVTVVLTDTSDYSNGRALASPRNTVVAELSPSGHFFESVEFLLSPASPPSFLRKRGRTIFALRIYETISARCPYPN